MGVLGARLQGLCSGIIIDWIIKGKTCFIADKRTWLLQAGFEQGVL